jgi:hypothetical protein
MSVMQIKPNSDNLITSFNLGLDPSKKENEYRCLHCKSKRLLQDDSMSIIDVIEKNEITIKQRISIVYCTVDIGF